jgi:hypothetical protein
MRTFAVFSWCWGLAIVLAMLLSCCISLDCEPFYEEPNTICYWEDDNGDVYQMFLGEITLEGQGIEGFRDQITGQHTIKLRSDFWCDVYFDEED